MRGTGLNKRDETLIFREWWPESTARPRRQQGPLATGEQAGLGPVFFSFTLRTSLLSTRLKEEAAGGGALAGSDRKHPIRGAARSELAALRFPRQQVRPNRRGCPQLRGQGAHSVSPIFLLALQPCPGTFGRALAPTRRHPGRSAAPGKGNPAGVPASWVETRGGGWVLEPAVELGLLISRGI